MESSSNMNINDIDPLSIQTSKPSDFLDKSKLINQDLIEIDGSILEGGGQILRISLALSLIFKKQIRIEKIRAGREKPGLKNQHLATVLGLKSIFKPEISGAEMQSEQLGLKPVFAIDDDGIELENITCDCGSAGSIGLMIQQVLPCLLFVNQKFNNGNNEIKLKFKGGTLVSFSPSTFYLNDVLKVILAEKMNVHFDLNVERHGIFPAGGGCVEFRVKRNIDFGNPQIEEKNYNLNEEVEQKYLNQTLIKSINVLKRGNLKKLVLRVIHTKNLVGLINLDAYLKTLLKEIKKLIIQNIKINYRFEDSVNLDYEQLENLNFLQIETSLIELPGNKPGYTLFTNANFYFENAIITAESLLSEKKSPTSDQRIKHKEAFFEEVETALSNENICFDEYTVDHLIIFMGLAKGISRISTGKISLHTLTAIEILKKFIPDIKIDIIKSNSENKLESNVIEIEGIGV